MHSTLAGEDVRGFIDEVKRTEDGNVYAKGWTFYHKNMEVLELRAVIGEEIIELKTHVRADVGNFYMNNSVNECGWDFFMDIEDTARVDINLYGEWKTVFFLKETEKKIQSLLDFKPKISKKIPSFLVVDNFYEDPDSVRDFALSANFKSHPESHKGKRTDETYLFEGLKERFEELIGSKIKDFSQYPVNGCFQYCIGGEQIVYHQDLQQYAGVLFLSPDAPPQSGTAFYRSLYNHKMRPSAQDHSQVYSKGFLDPTRFQEVDRVGNVYNRLVLFDAQSIHSGLNYYGTGKEDSRLFQLFFFDLQD